MLRNLGKVITGGVLSAALFLSGCAGQSGQTTGAVAGGAAGAALGSAIGGGTTGAVIGAIAGGVLGAKIGENMDQKDRQNTAQALESNQTMSWNNPDTGDAYTITPTNTYQSGGQTCRDYVMDANVDGQPQQVHGAACRQPDGTWVTQK